MWAEWFPQIVLVAPFRNPVGFVKSIAFKWPEKFEVAPTLQRGQSNELDIWEASNRRLLKLSETIPTWWVCFDDPIDTFKRRLATIIATFGRSLDSIAFDSFFVPSERRFSTSEELALTMSVIPDDTRALYETLRELSQSSSPTTLSATKLQ